MNICVVGTGYVGLVTGAVFADLGNDVVCVDNDQQQDRACSGPARCRSTSPGLEEMVARNTATGGSAFTTDLAGGGPAGRRRLHRGRHPAQGRRGETDLSHVEAVAAEIGRSMDRYKVVVNKSTVPVGTGELVREVITRHQPRPIDVRRGVAIPSSCARARPSRTRCGPTGS